VQEAACGPAFRLALEVAERAVVVEIAAVEGSECTGRGIDRVIDDCGCNTRAGLAEHQKLSVGARSGSAAPDRGVWCTASDQCAAGMVDLKAGHRRAGQVGRVDRRIALAVGKVRPRDDRQIFVVARVQGAGARRGRTEGGQIAEVGRIVVAVVVEAVVAVDLDAFVVGIEHEVDDACDGVCAVNRRGTAGEHIHALDQRRGDLVDVGRVGIAAGDTARAAGIETLAVHQHQGAHRAEIAQAHGRHTDRADGGTGVLLGTDLRQVAEDVLNAHQAGLLDVVLTHTRDGADRDLVRGLQQARTRDDDLLHGGRRLRGGCLGQRQRSR